MPFPEPSLIIIFFRLWQPDPLLCLLCIHSFCPRTSRQCDGVSLVLSLGAPDRHFLGHGIKRRSNHPVGVRAGYAPRPERPRFCVGVCLAGGRTGLEAPAATPEEAGPRRGSAWCGFHRRRPRLFRYLARHLPLHPEPSSPAGAAQEPSMAFFPANPAFCLFSRFLISPL